MSSDEEEKEEDPIIASLENNNNIIELPSFDNVEKLNENFVKVATELRK